MAASTPLDRLPAFASLQAHAKRMNATHLRDLFAADPGRTPAFTVEAHDIHTDFSKQRVDPAVMSDLIALLGQTNFASRRAAMFAGEHINVTENRAVLHVALRAPRTEVMRTDGIDVVPQVHAVLDRMGAFAEGIRSGAWKGFSGKRIRNIVNIGIGGSDLGPAMANDALRDFAQPDLQFRFVSNVDPGDFAWKTAGLDPAETLFIVASKTFTTQETMTNARTARAWSLAAFGGDEKSVARHFVAVSTAADLVTQFGIDPANMFIFWDWVGGRYSMDSAIGLATMIAIGAPAFGEMLAGFHEMDRHFLEAPAERNLPVLLGLLQVWNTDFMGFESHAVLPYCQHFTRFAAYLQQLEMESNGKRVQLDGTPVKWRTCPVIWGEPGTNGQHAFYQMLHQGNITVPADFIAFAEPNVDSLGMHDMLLANAFAQTRVMGFGQTADELRALGTPEHLIVSKVMPGNRPTTFILCRKRTPRALGQLVALYEHATFTAGAVWNVNSFDQWGVELGKKVASTLLPMLTGPATPAPDPSTESLVRRYRHWRNR
ncbi:MAG: glucose-6-phosphate isomerase [Planctomycetota bacterium]